MSTLEWLGWIGSIAFALAGLPQAIKSIKDKHARGIAWGFLFLWATGTTCSFIYVIPTDKYPLMVNYFFNMIFVYVIIYYKIKGKPPSSNG